MKAVKASTIVERALTSPIETWPGYNPQFIPLAVYDAQNVVYFNHPDPPRERPDQLTAATAVEINDVVTATVPAEMCEDKAALIPLVYHECFHAYQHSAFQFDEQFNFFKMLSLYPELNSGCRALCSAEAQVLNDSELSSKAKASYLAALADQRHQILSEHKRLLAFESYSERSEGTASYVEQRARIQLFDRPVGPVPCRYGWSRQYAIGAAACWLLAELLEGWQTRVEAGESPTGILMQAYGQEKGNLADLELAEKEAQEKETVAQTRDEIQARINRLVEAGAIHIRLPASGQISRSFSPMSIMSLGDGRLVHPDFLLVQTPFGQVSLRGGDIVEDYIHNELLFEAVPVRYSDGRLEAETEMVQIHLTDVTVVAKNEFQVG